MPSLISRLFGKKQKTPIESLNDRIGNLPTGKDLDDIYRQIYSSDRNVREWNSMTRKEQGELLRYVLNKRQEKRNEDRR